MMARDAARRNATAVTSATTASFADRLVYLILPAWTRLPHPLLDRLATHARSRCRTTLPDRRTILPDRRTILPYRFRSSSNEAAVAAEAAAAAAVRLVYSSRLKLGGTGPNPGLVQCWIGPKPGLVQCGTGPDSPGASGQEEAAAEEAAGSCVRGKRRGAVTQRRRMRPSHLNRSSCSLRQELLPSAYALPLQCGHSDGPDDLRASFTRAAHTALLHA